MDDLIGQKFLIESVVEPNPWIGADPPPMMPGATAPVITMGDMKDWSIVDGYLVLNGGWYSTYDEDRVVVRSGVIQGTKWVIIREAGGYRIRSPDTPVFWTATSIDPKTPVILVPGGSVDPMYQLWNFVPAN